ncbi:NADH:ubiquinone oxidoreductase subunit J [Paenibacillus marchantiophytorum]|uniref:NADH-quinone oxidoreductase subunit J n=1 Tax=Paenibacillus marchantiophytorum TaxID=1619310 RepID=A0ABQ1FIB6_9BACL|nr:NADH-quinone oxidoreductase subunit J [Paenibacillus marchantiophytorum]GGA12237.1 NADH:ubiquinone oxidoreductase subunit J [Paenibacillus marchantiophytorum]
MFNGIGDFLSSGSSWAFFIFALLAIGGAIFMISFTKVVHMVIAVALTFISLAGLYIILEAEFLAFVQILIYAGAISILMIFGIMMTKHRGAEEEPRRPWHEGLAIIGAISLFGVLFYAIQKTTFVSSGTLDAGKDNTLEIGKLLYNEHVIPFEIMSVLLTVAFIGAIVVAKREED